MQIFFQSPTRRVSGCNLNNGRDTTEFSSTFSPLHVGSVVVTVHHKFVTEWFLAFSPLHVGSVVVTEVIGYNWTSPIDFQSPTRRVSGCNAALNYILQEAANDFQSPIRRVSGCNVNQYGETYSLDPLSVPYTSGQWL